MVLNTGSLVPTPTLSHRLLSCLRLYLVRSLQVMAHLRESSLCTRHLNFGLLDHPLLGFDLFGLLFLLQADLTYDTILSAAGGSWGSIVETHLICFAP